MAAGDETPDHRPLPSRLASAAHSRPLRETTGHHHDHGPGPLEYGGENARFIELIYPRDVGDVDSVYVRDGGADSMSGSRHRCGAHTCQYERWDDFAPSRSGDGLAAMPSYRLSGPRGPTP